MSIDNINPSQQKLYQLKTKCCSKNEQNSKKFQLQILTFIKVTSQITNNFLPCKFYHFLSSFLCLICLNHLIYDKKTIYCQLLDQNWQKVLFAFFDQKIVCLTFWHFWANNSQQIVFLSYIRCFKHIKHKTEDYKW